MGYSLAQMQSLLRQVGWPENLIVTMAAIGMAESSGNACIVGTLANNERSIGLWQININPALGRTWTKEQLCDPLFNAQVALQIYGQQGLRAWGAYTDGRYRKYIAQSQAIYSPNATPTPVTVTDTSIAPSVPQVADVTAGDVGNTDFKPVLITLGVGVALLWLLRS